LSEYSFGRPRTLTKEALLRAITELSTTRPSTLAKKLNVDPATVYRRFKEVTLEEKKEALGISTEKELPLSMMKGKNGYELFKEIPLIKEYYDALLYKRNMSEKNAKTRLRMLWRLCKWFRKRPSALTAEDVSELLTRIRRGDKEAVGEFKGGYDVRISSRSFFGFRGIGSVKLTNLGIGSETYEQNKTRSQARLTHEQRATILAEIHKRLGENWKSRDGRITIAFKDRPELACAVEIYPKVSYYIGIRAASAFEKSFWEVAEERDKRHHRSKFSGVIGLENFQPGDEIIFRHLDKGKRGGIAWTKRIFGEFAEEFHAYWIRQGKPKQGPIFAGLREAAVREFLKEVYEAAGIPEYIWQGSDGNEPMPLHIWRHTAAQDLLDATDWDFELVSTTLGWESIGMLKKHYGSMPPDVQRCIVLKAMGEEVPIIKREFVF
jgi:hypothetical protein